MARMIGREASAAGLPGRTFSLPAALLVAALGSLAPADSAGGGRSAGAVHDSMTVIECAGRATEVAPEVLAASEDARAAQLDALVAARNRRPDVSLHTSVQGIPPHAYDPALTNLGEYDLRLIGRMSLADGGARRREQLRTRAVAEGAGRDLAAARRENGLRAAELAAEILQSSARIGRHEAALQWTGRVLETIRSAARSGARSPADVARLELEQRGLEADIDADRRDRSALVRELGDLLGAPESWSPTISASHPGGALPTAADSASMVARADSFAEVRKAQSDVVIAELELTGAHAQKSVALSLTADAGWAGTGLSRWGPPGLAPNGTLSDRLRQDAGASVALELSRPLLAPGSELAVSAREASVSAARARLERVRREARRIALDLLGRWWYAAHDLPPLRSAAGQAESNLLRAQSLYVAGSLPLLDLLDARRVLEQSADRAEYAAGRLELALAQAEIWR